MCKQNKREREGRRGGKWRREVKAQTWKQKRVQVRLVKGARGAVDGRTVILKSVWTDRKRLQSRGLKKNPRTLIRRHTGTVNTEWVPAAHRSPDRATSLLHCRGNSGTADPASAGTSWPSLLPLHSYGDIAERMGADRDGKRENQISD